MKIGLTAVEEGQRIGLAIELRKIQFLEPRWAVTMVVIVARTLEAREGCRRWSLLLKGGNLPLQIIDGGSEGLDEFGQIGRVGSAIGDETEVVDGEGEDGSAAGAAGGGGAGVDEDRWKPDTRLSRALVPVHGH